MSDYNHDYYAHLFNEEDLDDQTDEDPDDQTDEEEDERHRPRKMNRRKSLAPLFIYQILTENSTPEKHFTQAQIISILEKYPYEISIERKAVGRALHLLADSGLGIKSTRTDGAWYDECACW